MFSYSQTQIIGRLGKDPELKTSQGGKKWATFSVATERYAGKDSDGNVKRETVWHNCTAFEKLADNIEKFAKKGDRIHVIGEYVYEENEGKRFYKILVSNVTFLSNSSHDSGTSQAKTASASAGKSTAAPTATDDDIPF
jgi:single-strand DNA-binding protein